MIEWSAFRRNVAALRSCSACELAQVALGVCLSLCLLPKRGWLTLTEALEGRHEAQLTLSESSNEAISNSRTRSSSSTQYNCSLQYVTNAQRRRLTLSLLLLHALSSRERVPISLVICTHVYAHGDVADQALREDAAEWLNVECPAQRRAREEG